MTSREIPATHFDETSTASQVIGGTALAVAGLGLSSPGRIRHRRGDREGPERGRGRGHDCRSEHRGRRSGRDEDSRCDERAGDHGPAIKVSYLDLADLRSVRAFAEAWEDPLDILVNNAGVMACPKSRSADGWELQFATNHLWHFVLAACLHSALAGAEGARVVSVSSRAHLRSRVDFADINFERRPYDRWQAYAQSKMANFLFAVGVSERWADDGITSNALMPGSVETNIHRHTTQGDIDTLFGGNAPVRTGPDLGAATSVFGATSPPLNGVGGRYSNTATRCLRDPGTLAEYAVDRESASRLWDISTGLSASSERTELGL